MSKESVICLIPARSGSKRLPGKNFKNFSGLPLIEWSIKIALESPIIDKVVVSTDIDFKSKYHENFKLSVIKRPSNLALDETQTSAVIEHALQDYLNFKYFFLFQPTSPLRIHSDIEETYKKLIRAEVSSVISVSRITNPKPLQSNYWLNGETLVPMENCKRLNGLPVAPNGLIYSAKIIELAKFDYDFNLIPKLGFISDEFRSIDIDYEADFIRAELQFDSK